MSAETARAGHTSAHIETSADPAAFKHWPDSLYDEMKRNEYNGVVGSILVSETDRVRVWHLRLPPGQRCSFHRHVNPYFWSAHTAGKARGYDSGGGITDAEYKVGETRHYFYGKGEYMLHSLENIGDTELVFTTVEFLDGPNDPLAVPDSVRRATSGTEAA